MGVEKVFLTGYTPYPKSAHDDRLPHLAIKTDKQIAKISLGAEKYVDWHRSKDIFAILVGLKKQGYKIACLEQSPSSQLLVDFAPPPKLALIVGREVEGIEQEVIDGCDHVLEIPMQGQKESFNVVQAAAMALFLLSLKQQGVKIT